MSLKRIAIYGLTALALASCESQSEIDTDFLGSPSGPFSSQFTFANSSQYNFDSSKIDFTNGYAELSSSSQTDSSNVANGFAGGSSTGTAWSNATDGNGNNNYIMLNQTGTPTNTSELDSSWAPSWANIVGLWHLDEITGGSVYDSSGNTKTGTLVGGSILGAVGKLNNAGAFNGSNYVDALTLGPAGNSNWTESAWIKTSSTSAGVVFSNRQGSSGPSLTLAVGFWAGSATSNGDVYFSIDTDTCEYGAISAVSVADGNWHHIVGVRSGTSTYTYTVYVDGVVQGQNNSSAGGGCQTSSASSSDPWRIGFHLPWNSYFNGTLDELAIWNTALTPAQIQTIYSRQSAKYAGTFTSRVMDGLSTSASWTNFSWMPTLPFFKELPDDGVSETQASYSSQSASLMSGIVGLWHLDEPSWNGTNGEVKDSSGNGNSGTAIGGYQVAGGKWGNGAGSSNGSSYVLIGNANGFPAGSAPRTISTWFKISPAGLTMTAGTIFNTGGNSYDGERYDMWYAYNGGSPFLAVECRNVGMAFAWTPDTNWHHFVAVVPPGASYCGQSLLYLDGKLSNTPAAGGPILNTDNVNPTIGAWTFTSGAGFIGNIDEVAIWNRALTDGTGGTPNEILELYRRGANRLKYQIRTCADSTCSTNPSWQGPDNTNQTYFSELNNTLANAASGAVQAGLPSMLFSNFGSLTVPTNRYFQYRAIMESDDTSTNCNYGSGVTWCSPELKSVNVGPGHYDTTSPTVSNKTGVSYATLTNLIESLGTSGCSSGTLYNLSPDNIHWYYWTGAAWGLAGGASTTANSAATITSNLATFAPQLGVGSIYFKVFLQSSGTSACAIDNLEVDGTQ